MRKICRNAWQRIAFGACILAACPVAAVSQERSTVVDTGVILPVPQSAFAKFVVARDLYTFWMPTSEDVAQLETKLKQYLEGQMSPEAKAIAESLGTYQRQYLGYIEGGQKWVLAIAFCEEFWRRNDGWREQIAIVYNGGHCFFHVSYNPASARFDGLEVNDPGPAEQVHMQ